MKHHYKKILLIFFFSLQFSFLKAQWVTIPDSNFVNFLNSSIYASCMNGNLMDTTCSTIVNEIEFICLSANIYDLNGIQYFDNLTSLNCGYNHLTSLPPLPPLLLYLFCTNNQITSLPTLPDSLISLECYNNSLTSIPTLPAYLGILDCSFNQLTSLPTLPLNLGDLICSYNQLTSLPELPPVLYYLHISNNPNLVCIPKITTVVYDFQFFNTGIQCLPNYGNVTGSCAPPLSSLPLCDMFNANACNFYWNISGKAYGDTNVNCVNDAGEFGAKNLKVNLYIGNNLLQQTLTIDEGLYSFDTDTGTYTYTVDTPDIPVLVTCPAAGFQTSVLTAIDSMDYDMDFGMQCKPGFDVGVASVIRDSGIFRPAHFAKVKIAAGDISNFYGLHCAAGTSGSVKVVFNGAVSFISASSGALVPAVSGDTLLYSIADFGTVNFNSDFSFTMQTDTTATIGSQVCFDVNVFPLAGDINPANNILQYCFTVVNSFDPNIKEVFPEGNIDTTQHWLTYTINFQNTGTATAQHIYILDTLDNSLYESSFTLLSYSHQPLTQVMGNVVRFNFPNINLPDSTSDEPQSHGYVQYKVKLKSGLTNGTLIHNTGNIYFDFGSPVTTNTTENQILITTGMEGFKVSGFGVKVKPNPFHTSTLMKINSPLKSINYNLEIYDVLGNKVREINCKGKNEIVIERKNLAGGIYIFKLFNEKELMGTGKLVVQ